MKGSLLQELVAYAATSSSITPPNFGPTTLYWQLKIDRDGVPQPQLTPLDSTEVLKSGKTRQKRGRVLDTPKIGRTSGIRPMLGPDGLDYVLGWGAEDQERAKNALRHAAYLELHRAWADAVTVVADPLPHAFVRFLENHVDEVERPAEWAAKEGVLITIGDTHLHNSPTAAAFWGTQAGAAKSSGETGVCLVCGMVGVLVKSFPQMVRGPLVPGGQSSGVAPVSVNTATFGYDLKDGLGHVPICERCAYAVPAALNALLADDSHTTRDSRTATTWWVNGPASLDDDFAQITVAEPRTVRDLMTSASAGRQFREGIDLGHFNSLVVSGNASRLVVNRWYRVPVDEVRANLACWFADTQIQPRFADGREFHPLLMLAQATGRHDGKWYLKPGAPGGRHPDDIVQRLHACAYERAPLPPQVLAHVLQRIGADHRIDEPRAALLRLALTRNPHVKETIMPGLDPENTSPCYVAGRLFAAYDDLQAQSVRAGGEQLNATFAEKHLAGAISAPRLALAAGEKQSPAWLSKLRRTKNDEGKSAHFAQKHIDDIVALLSPADPIPARASLEEQALFVLGYHHERANTWRARAEGAAKKAKDNDAATSNTTPA